MPSIHLQDLSLATPDGRELVSHLDLTFAAHRTGLVGRNGTGKTTLLRAILGEVVPKAGRVHVEGSLGVLRQVPFPDDVTVATALGVSTGLARLARIENGTADTIDHDRADWPLPSRLAQALNSVGLPPLDSNRPTGTLSGGQRTRLSLAALLLQQPDMLLLDEPTNNLDAEGRAAVAELLRNWRGGAVVISHDRELLHYVDEIVELTGIGSRSYGGNWGVYAARRALDLAAAEHDLATAERRLADISRKAQDRAERKDRAENRGTREAAKGGKPRILLGREKDYAEQSRGAQSRLADKQHASATADLATARAELEVLQPLTVALEATHLPAGRTILQMERVTGGAGSSPIIRDLSLTLTGPERAAITGPNGAGKTTLLRLATGDLPPAAGTARITSRHAVLDQHLSLLDRSESIRDNYRRLHPADRENQCRAALARFRFRAEAALQTVGSLSGGEMLRAGLAVTIGSSTPPELLILDEPTNHLDLEAIAAVEAGLRAFDGGLLVVSHDTAFLNAIGITRYVALG